jgi:hypothetical protein
MGTSSRSGSIEMLNGLERPQLGLSLAAGNSAALAT